MNIYCHICVKSNLWRRRQQRVWRKPLLISFKRLQVNESCDGSRFSFSNHSILTKDAKISARSKIPALRTTKIAYYNNIIWKLNIDINKAICKCKYELNCLMVFSSKGLKNEIMAIYLLLKIAFRTDPDSQSLTYLLSVLQEGISGSYRINLEKRKISIFFGKKASGDCWVVDLWHRYCHITIIKSNLFWITHNQYVSFKRDKSLFVKHDWILTCYSVSTKSECKWGKSIDLFNRK